MYYGVGRKLTCRAKPLLRDRRLSPSLDQQSADAAEGEGGQQVSVILVVDDDSATRFLVRSILEIAGHKVIEAPHGPAALQLISPEHVPDVVVTDLTMPVLN